MKVQLSREDIKKKAAMLNILEQTEAALEALDKVNVQLLRSTGYGVSFSVPDSVLKRINAKCMEVAQEEIRTFIEAGRRELNLEEEGDA